MTATGKGPELSIVVPVFNEAENLPALIRSITRVCEELAIGLEILLVDDGSDDGSWDVVHALAEKNHRLAAVRFTRNFGKEAAIYAGLTFARAQDILVMDADLQHPPELIKKMWALKHGTDADVVSAIKRTRQKESLPRGIGARVFYWLFKRSTGIDLALSTDFKMISRRVRDLYVSTPERFRFFRGLTRWFGFPEQTVLFDPPSRPSSQPSRWSDMGLLRYAVDSLISFSALPVRAMGWLGAATFLFGFVLGIQTLFNKLNGHAVEGFTTVILTVLIMGSLLMMGLSIVGGYMVEIFRQVQQRPSFIISEAVKINLEEVPPARNYPP
jgi:dolichol-phosphate mannosyltransferase